MRTIYINIPYAKTKFYGGGWLEINNRRMQIPRSALETRVTRKVNRKNKSSK